MKLFMTGHNLTDVGHSYIRVESASLIEIPVALCHSHWAAVFISVRRLCLTAGCVCACVSCRASCCRGQSASPVSAALLSW